MCHVPRCVKIVLTLSFDFLKGEVHKINLMTDKKEDIAHYFSILLEDVRSDFKFAIESVLDMETRINKRMDERFEKVDQRFEVIESVLKEHSQNWVKNEQRWEQNEKRWKENNQKWKETARTLKDIQMTVTAVCHKVSEHDKLLENHVS